LRTVSPYKRLIFLQIEDDFLQIEETIIKQIEIFA